ncbi:MAG TPA: prepilin-type N-terminal cleavage/methylation domain-containing protein [Blastocatellia bacterium]|nr:prepilin-type N-terminal cleavage/methylation domain-containing protein [Blastocatellia bacterium]
MKREQGFSLVELLIVVVIIGVIAAVAIPGLQKARRYAQSGSAIQSLRTVTTAQILYQRRYNVYGSLAQLGPEGTIDPSLAVGDKSGYTFTLILSSDLKHFTCNGDPQQDPGTGDFFFVDETTVIRSNTGSPADVNSNPIPR